MKMENRDGKWKLEGWSPWTPWIPLTKRDKYKFVFLPYSNHMRETIQCLKLLNYRLLNYRTFKLGLVG